MESALYGVYTLVVLYQKSHSFASLTRSISDTPQLVCKHRTHALSMKYSIFIIWLALRASKMTQITRCDWLPERARWSHLARSGQSAASRKKNFPGSHIINPLLTKFVRSRWLDIGLVLFL